MPMTSMGILHIQLLLPISNNKITFQSTAPGDLPQPIDLFARGIPQILLVETLLPGPDEMNIQESRDSFFGCIFDLIQVEAYVDPLDPHQLPSTFPCNLCSHLHKAEHPTQVSDSMVGILPLTTNIGVIP